jgi:hypothetical protein
MRAKVRLSYTFMRIKVCYSYSGGGALRDAISCRQFQSVAKVSRNNLTRHLAQLVE